MQDVTTVASVSPWHEGELELQRRAGVLERMALVGPRNIRDHLIGQHRDFFPLLPFVVVGSVDPRGGAWATLMAGPPRFLSTPDDKTLRVRASVDSEDPVAAGLRDGDAIGVLGIQLETRRRNRLNGTVRRTTETSFDVVVEHSFGNCAQYITPREHRFVRDPTRPASAPAEVSGALDDRAAQIIGEADTLFVASYLDREDGRRQVDVSHRGGKPGFAMLDGQGLISIPDFPGNSFFNTLGNILKNPRCALLFVNYESGDMLHLSGEGEVLFDRSGNGGPRTTERIWCFRTRKAVFRSEALPLRFALREEPQ